MNGLRLNKVYWAHVINALFPQKQSRKTIDAVELEILIVRERNRAVRSEIVMEKLKRLDPVAYVRLPLYKSLKMQAHLWTSLRSFAVDKIMRTYKLTIAYDGTNYQGWQRQSDTDRTIQGFWKRRWKLHRYQVQIDSWRTMPEFMQAARRCERCLPGKIDGFVWRKMNGCLPPDIRIWCGTCEERISCPEKCGRKV